jgi:hypothetical protein
LRALGHTAILQFLACAAPERTHVCRLHCAGAPGHAGVLELVIIMVVLARAAPERPHVVTSRVLALLGELIVHEIILALVRHHAPPGRWLVAIIGSAPRRHGNVSDVAGLDRLGAQATHTAFLGRAPRRHGRARSSAPMRS